LVNRVRRGNSIRIVLNENKWTYLAILPLSPVGTTVKKYQLNAMLGDPENGIYR
jgi:hypothetical protein